MTIEEILAQWKIDQQIGITSDKIIRGTSHIPPMHSYYYQILLTEKKTIRKLESELSKLRKEKYEFYDGGPEKKQKEKHKWALPAKGYATSKKELDLYLAADEELIAFNLSIEEQKDKIELIKEILEMIKNRSFHLRLILDTRKFESGG